MNWQAITKFNFTHALPGGAWLEDSSGNREWNSFSTIQKHVGDIWIDAQIKAQGWITGCWIDVVPVVYRKPLIPVAINGVPVRNEMAVAS
jgi:hypothetical protein